MAASAGPLNTVVLDNGICGRNLQLGSDPTASSSATPTFLLYGDGAAASYRVFIDGALLGTFNTSNPYGNVCITTTVALSQGAHTLTGNELSPHATYTVTPFQFSVDTVPPAVPSAPVLNPSTDFGRHRRQHHDLPVPEPERHVRAECPDPGLRRPRGGRRWASRQHGPLDGHDDDALDCPPHPHRDRVRPGRQRQRPVGRPQPDDHLRRPATAPGAPSLTSATAGNGSVTLAWSAPANGGSPITGYKVYRGTSAGTDAAHDARQRHELHRHGPTNGTTYYYKVSALNAVGEGGLSERALRHARRARHRARRTQLDQRHAPATAPSARLERARRTAARAITGYRVYRGTSAGTADAAHDARQRHRLDQHRRSPTAPPTTTRSAPSTRSARAPARTSAPPRPPRPPPRPARPPSTRRTAGNGSVTLAWSAPAPTAARAITGYKVYRGTSAGTGRPAHHARHRHRLDRQRRRQRHHLLLQGQRPQRGRRGRPVERALAPPPPRPPPRPAHPRLNRRPPATAASRSPGARPLQRRLRDHRLQVYRGTSAGNGPAHHARQRHQLHRQRRSPTAPPTTTRSAPSTRSARAAVERALRHPRRARHRARRTHASTRRHRRQRQRHARLERARSNGGSRDHRLQGLPRHQRRHGRPARHARHRHRLHRHQRSPTAPPTTTRSAPSTRSARAPTRTSAPPRPPPRHRARRTRPQPAPPPATAASRSPGARPAPTAAPRSPATRSTAAPAPARQTLLTTLGTVTGYTDNGARQRHHLLLQGQRPQRGRRGRPVQRALRHPRRARHRARRTRPQPAPPPATASVTLAWSAPASNGGSPITGYKVYRGTSAGNADAARHARQRHQLHRHQRHQRHDLLLQGQRPQRGRRGRPLQRALGHASCCEDPLNLLYGDGAAARYGNSSSTARRSATSTL